jgi:hypothetical protein
VHCRLSERVLFSVRGVDPVIGQQESHDVKVSGTKYVDMRWHTTMWMSPWYPFLLLMGTWCLYMGYWILPALAYAWYCVVPVHDFGGTMLPYVAPLVALMLRWCYNRVWVVPRDFLATIRAHRHPNQVTVLCASHTSYMDFIVLPFILYAMSPFLDIERPRIVACRTFAAIPVLGTILRWCGAVYVDRPGHPVSLATSRQSLVDTLLECILSRLYQPWQPL